MGALAIWSAVPQGVKNIAYILLAISALVGYHFLLVHEAVAAQKAQDDAKIAADRAIYQAQLKSLQAKQATVVTQTVTEYVDRVKIVKEKGDAIVKEVPVLVHSDCVLDGGVRVSHDSAARGDLPDDPEGAARAAAPVDAVTLTQTVATNYATCLTNAARLTSLQTLVQRLKGVTP